MGGGLREEGAGVVCGELVCARLEEAKSEACPVRHSRSRRGPVGVRQCTGDGLHSRHGIVGEGRVSGQRRQRAVLRIAGALQSASTASLRASPVSAVSKLLRAYARAAVG